MPAGSSRRSFKLPAAADRERHGFRLLCGILRRMGAVLPRRELLARGAGFVDPDRLRAAVDFVVGRVRPDQLILHGSAARGLFTDGSDIDFLAVRSSESGVDRFPDDRYWWRCPATGDEVDVLLATRERLEERRRAAGSVHSAVLSDGFTVFSRPGAVSVVTGARVFVAGDDMVRKSTLDPHRATVFLDGARDRFRSATRDFSAGAPALACEMLQSSVERAFKALIIAHGSSFEHTHNLGDLWDQVESFGERVSAIRDEAVLREVTLYAGDRSYDFPSADESAVSYRSFVRRLATSWITRNAGFRSFSAKPLLVDLLHLHRIPPRSRVRKPGGLLRANPIGDRARR